MDDSDEILPGEPPVPDLDEPVTPSPEELHDVEGAVEHFRSLLSLSRQTDSARIRMRLGLSLYRRYSLLGDPVSLNEAISELDQAIELADHPDDAWAKAYLGSFLLRRYVDLNDDPSLNRCILVSRESLGQVENSAHSWWIFANLGSALRRKYELNRQRTFLDEATDTFQEALEHSSDPNSAKIRLNLSYCLVDSYDDFGDIAGLVTAAGHLEDALDKATGPLRVIILVQLGDVSIRRYESQGFPICLETAIHSYETALAASVPIDYPTVLSNLGNALRARYVRAQNSADLDRAIAVLEAALDATPRSSDKMPRRTLNYCHSVLDRYRVSKDADEQELEAPIATLRWVTARCSFDNPDRPRLLSTLSEFLLARNHSQETYGDRDEAVDFLRKAVSIAPPSFSQRPQILALLANVLAAQERPGSRTEATKCLAEALLMTSSSDPDYSSIANAFVHSAHISDPVLYRRNHQALSRNIVIAVIPFANERASTFSRTTLFLQRYLKSLDPDRVESLLDREPPSDVEATRVPAAGQLVVYLEPRSEKFSALASILKLWADKNRRHVVITFTFSGEPVRVELEPAISEGEDQGHLSAVEAAPEWG